MGVHSPLVVISVDADGEAFADQLRTALNLGSVHHVYGSSEHVLQQLTARPIPPLYLVIETVGASEEVLAYLDGVAEHCAADTHAVVIGTVNDIQFYRALKDKGILEYFLRPARITDIRNVLTASKEGDLQKAGSAKVITFLSAASGDGASTVAVNTAYLLATQYRMRTIVVDMDFQFGMVARNLDVSSPYGIRELLEDSGRVIDNTLLRRMTVRYQDTFDIISAPAALKFWPEVQPEAVKGLVTSLASQYDVIVLDLPHIWAPWVANVIGLATHNVVVAQMWLRSVTHTARIFAAWKEAQVDMATSHVMINRSGAKFKEAITARDFEAICGHPISAFLANDIKLIASAESQGRTLSQMGESLLNRQLSEFVGRVIMGQTPVAEVADAQDNDAPRSRLGSIFQRKV
jgi:pilus assembly protein CpaE